ncbi:MAG: hypothetical protein IJD71_00150, partial [Clostridia bacterium]|nr:hypothetical protein [Clostridia bacterium]
TLQCINFTNVSLNLSANKFDPKCKFSLAGKEIISVKSIILSGFIFFNKLRLLLYNLLRLPRKH